MSKPPIQPRRCVSPALSSLSDGSIESSLQAELHGFLPGSTLSPQIQKLFAAFESAKPFSQLEGEGGRGSQVILQNVGLLTHIWANRDPGSPAHCFDKHDGRTGTKIYNPPRRGPGGVLIPCTLQGTNTKGNGAIQSINIINNNISLQSMVYPTGSNEMAASEDIRGNSSKRRAVQSTLKAVTKPGHSRKDILKNKQGRFVKKKIVPKEHLRGTSPSIPLNTRGLRRLLQQWVKGDKERGLQKPLAEFSCDERNGKDRTGKPNKMLYSKRRTVALATLLALQDAFENRKSFSNAIGVEMGPQELAGLPLSRWEKVAKSYLRKGRKMTQAEVIDLGMKLYRKEILDLLPEGNC